MKVQKRIQGLLARLTWSQGFMLVSLAVFLIGMVGVGWWMSQQIESSVIQQSAGYASLYVSSVVEPDLQELANGDSLTPDHQATLARLLQDSTAGQRITDVKVWDKQGRVVYDASPQNINQTFPIDPKLASALRGWVASDISNLDKPQNAYDVDRGTRRMETFSPVRRTGTNQIIAAVEFHQTVDNLDRNIAATRQQSWLIVGVTALVMYLLLAGFVRIASDTIRRQQNELSNQVVRLQDLLSQNEELHERVRRAARRSAALNERFLRRISAELHDGPVQDLSLAMLRLDHLLPPAKRASSPMTPSPMALSSVASSSTAEDQAGQQDFQVVQNSLGHALQEIRAISVGMGLPELENLALTETIVRAVRAHERRTGTRVDLDIDSVPTDVPVPVKITAYRIIQEALSNAYRHANGASQRVQVSQADKWLSLIVSDRGPGFDRTHLESDGHLGLVGMRERVESLGGIFKIESTVGQGTRVIARLPLDSSEGPDE